MLGSMRGTMLALLLRRLAFTIPMLVVVSFCVFSLIVLVPGDPAIALAGENPSPEQIADLLPSLDDLASGKEELRIIGVLRHHAIPVAVFDRIEVFVDYSLRVRLLLQCRQVARAGLATEHATERQEERRRSREKCRAHGGRV